MRFGSPLCFIILFCLPSLVFCQRIVWISDTCAKWTELGLIGNDPYWQEGQGEKYREISRLENNSGIAEVILDCPGRNCRYKLSNKDASEQRYESSLWSVFLYGNFIPASISNVDFYIEENQIVFTYSLSSSELNAYFDIAFELQNELDGKVISPRSLTGEYDCVKASNSGENNTQKTVKWNALKDGVNLSGRYRLVCYANPSSKVKINKKQVLENQIRLQEEERKQKEINRRNFLKERANTIYNYCQLEPNVIKTNESLLETIVQQSIDKYSNGLIDVNFSYKFDTLGLFKGKVMAYGNMASPINQQLALNYSKLSLTPSVKNDMYVASECSKNYNISWKTDYYQFKKRKNIIKPIGKTIDSPMSSINKQILNNRYNGKYTYVQKSIVCSGNTFSTLSFYKFKNNGPLNALYSLVLPGVGTKRVTEYDKGTGRMILFILSAGISAVSKYYSNTYYNRYLNSMDQVNIQYNYRMANNLQKSFLVTGGIAATIYVYDFIHVLGKGIKNKAEQKSINQSLLNKEPLIKEDFHF